MDNFRRRTRDNQRQVIDSILNAPTRSDDVRRPLGRRPVQMDGLRSTSGRRVDDFRRAEGYHAAQSTSVRASAPPLTQQQQPPAPQAHQQGSLLHMTLPSGGVLGASQQEGRKKHRPKHGRLRTVRKWALRSTITLVILVLLGGGFLATKAYLKLHKVFKGGGTAAALQADVKPELLKGEGDGRVNILLLGRGGPGHQGPDLTDTILLASVDPVNKTTSLISVPRDLWVSVSGMGSTKINAVYANAKSTSLNRTKDSKKAHDAGIAAVQQVVGQVLGVPIHYYTMIDFKAFQQAIDTVGGVTINVPEDLIDYSVAWENKNSPVLARKGVQTFNGKQALLYVRSRHGTSRGDFDRTERQRLVIAALTGKILSAGTYTNPLKISQLMSDFGDHVTTDLSTSNALRLAEIGKGMGPNGFKSIGLADPPNNFVRTDNVDGLSVVRPTAGFGDYSEIQNFIRNTVKDPYLAKENATIMVLNGTDSAGLATKQGDILKTYGYNVTRVGDAPTHEYAYTILVDMTAGQKPFTKNYLEKRLDTKAVGRLPDETIQASGVDFVIILGQDAQ